MTSDGGVLPVVVRGQDGGEVDILLLDGVDHGLRGDGVDDGGLLRRVVDELKRELSLKICLKTPNEQGKRTRYM